MKPPSKQVVVSIGASLALILFAGSIVALRNYAARGHTAQTQLHGTPTLPSPTASDSPFGVIQDAPTATPSATVTATPTPAATVRPTTRPASPSAAPIATATPFVPPAGYAIPDANDGTALGYDEADGYPLLLDKANGGPQFAMWKWDGTGWIRLAPGQTAPWPQTQLVYDPALHRTVMLAGTPMAPPTVSLWAWDGSAWSDLHSQNTPDCPVGGQFYLAFDVARNTLVLLCNQSSETTATWLFDGTTWTKASAAANPPPHVWAGFAYDPRHANVLLAGGTNSMGTTNVSDTWTWDGSSWTQRHGPAPPGGPTTIGFDAANGQMVLVQAPLGSTAASSWTWDGSNWTPLAVTLYFGGYATITFDAAHRGLLLFEGNGQYETSSQTWFYAGNTWTRRS